MAVEAVGKNPLIGLEGITEKNRVASNPMTRESWAPFFRSSLRNVLKSPGLFSQDRTSHSRKLSTNTREKARGLGGILYARRARVEKQKKIRTPGIRGVKYLRIKRRRMDTRVINTG
jgi:hypothetical protein